MDKNPEDSTNKVATDTIKNNNDANGEVNSSTSDASKSQQFYIGLLFTKIKQRIKFKNSAREKAGLNST